MNTQWNGRIAAAAAGTAIAAFLTAGCHDDTPPTVVTAPQPSTTTVVPGSAPAAASPAVPDTKVNTNAGPGGSAGTDSALADQVNTAIVHNKQMTGARVEVVATSGVVTLNGQVQNQQQKALAETTANQVPGVSSIKNKLIIVTTGGAKPRPTVVTKIKTIVVHDHAAAPSADTGSPDSTQGTTATPDQSPSVPPSTSDQGAGQTAPPATNGTTGQ